MCIDFLYTYYLKYFFILRVNERDIVIMYTGLHVKYTLFLSDFNET